MAERVSSYPVLTTGAPAKTDSLGCDRPDCPMPRTLRRAPGIKASCPTCEATCIRHRELGWLRRPDIERRDELDFLLAPQPPGPGPGHGGRPVGRQSGYRRSEQWYINYERRFGKRNPRDPRGFTAEVKRSSD